ncbi:MAG: hypothetical protein GY703_20875 [Gammaproteobacteria bacterium]|nr:hypothetical protein [Gammaproteobacteria bacterium]
MFKALQEAIQSPQQPSSKRNSGYQVRNREQIIQLLTQAHRARLLFDVEIPGGRSHYTTALLGIQKNSDTVTLDELTPAAGHKQLLSRRQMTLTSKLEGVALRFKVSLVESSKEDGVALYKVRLPESVYYMQRRQYFRIALTGCHAPFQAKSDGDSEELLTGYVTDLSLEGIGIILEGEKNLSADTTLSNCIIQPPDQGRIPFSLIIRHCKINEKRHNTRVGGYFDQIDRYSQRKIGKIITQLEREHARRLSGN